MVYIQYINYLFLSDKHIFTELKNTYPMERVKESINTERLWSEKAQ